MAICETLAVAALEILQPRNCRWWIVRSIISSIVCGLGLAWIALSPTALGQSALDSPIFRPRTDAMAVQDADAVRERLRSLSDSRGPINPLADYGKSNRTKPEPSPTKSNKVADEEATRVPSLDTDAQRRLKAQPPSVSPSELSVIGLYPPPRITSQVAINNLSSLPDDGFRPLIGLPITANYQISDPAAMVPPSLGLPSGSVPSYTAPPISAPPIGAPPIGAPATVLPPPSSPSFPVTGMPSTGVPIGGVVGGNVLPAPPSYVVPSPSGINPSISPSTPMGSPSSSLSGAPYAPATPTYSREGTTVNSLPFVSPPPQARDARWMVSPEVYRRMESNACGPNTPIPTNSPTVASAPSPFFYAPPAAMPMPNPYASTPYTAGRHSWLHPFRHLHHRQ